MRVVDLEDREERSIAYGDFGAVDLADRAQAGAGLELRRLLGVGCRGRDCFGNRVFRPTLHAGRQTEDVLLAKPSGR